MLESVKTQLSGEDKKGPNKINGGNMKTIQARGIT